MKKYLLLFLPILLVSCEQELDGLEKNSEINYWGMIEGIGLDASSAVDMGDYFVVEGDIKVNKEELPKYGHEEVTTRQAHAKYIVSRWNSTDIRIKIAENVNNTSNWREAILAVLQHYNDVESSLYLYESTASPHITISFGQIDDWGIGEFPTADYKPGKTITIQNSTDANNLSLLQKTFLIAHEMGHNLGLRHTDYLTKYGGYAEGTGIYGANHIPWTPTGTIDSQDPNSVFNSGKYYGRVIPWRGFSDHDRYALYFMFLPYSLRDIQSEMTGTFGDLLYIRLNNYPPELRTVWELTGSGYRIMEAHQDRAILIMDETSSTHSTITARLNYKGDQRTISYDLYKYLIIKSGHARLEGTKTIRSIEAPSGLVSYNFYGTSANIYVDYNTWIRDGQPALITCGIWYTDNTYDQMYLKMRL